MTATAQALRPSRLPSIDDNPEGDVVIYDSHCKFCTTQVARLAKLDGTGKRLAFLSLHDPLVQERWPDLTHEMLMEQMYVVDHQGNRHAGADSFRYLTRRLPWLWILAPVLHIPFSLPFWRWGYRQVAKRRYQFMGKNADCDDGACKIHFEK